MKAMILAAGRGQRMLHLTDATPKVLLPIAGKPLIQHHVERLRAAGISEIVINHAYFGEQIQESIGNGESLGVHIQYSPEPPGGLETAGGVYRALPILGPEPFIVVNGDVWTDFPFEHLFTKPNDAWAHLILVKNPDFKPEGDFYLHNNRVALEGTESYTYSGIGAYHPEFFQNVPQAFYPMRPLFNNFITANQVTGECYQGIWSDIGTPERYQRCLDEYG